MDIRISSSARKMLFSRGFRNCTQDMILYRTLFCFQLEIQDEFGILNLPRKSRSFNFFTGITSQDHITIYSWPVNVYAKVESERLQFFRRKQKALGADNYGHRDVIIARDGDPQNVVQKVVLPAIVIDRCSELHF
ncbi:hypothetical protein ElyMa_001770700 [Elysia marginata]|uniref:Uncharacterized protein n=1 Tax=Elysia marginata TaxID=1093978 RepID=A0AAV4ECZ7_9GAST|nr:hypothetical protein ElyMa_001770700 [Elysia marginata]